MLVATSLVGTDDAFAGKKKEYEKNQAISQAKPARKKTTIKESESDRSNSDGDVPTWYQVSETIAFFLLIFSGNMQNE
jgi:hypothetical protein